MPAPTGRMSNSWPVSQSGPEGRDPSGPRCRPPHHQSRERCGTCRRHAAEEVALHPAIAVGVLAEVASRDLGEHLDGLGSTAVRDGGVGDEGSNWTVSPRRCPPVLVAAAVEGAGDDAVAVVTADARRREVLSCTRPRGGPGCRCCGRPRRHTARARRASPCRRRRRSRRPRRPGTVARSTADVLATGALCSRAWMGLHQRASHSWVRPSMPYVSTRSGVDDSYHRAEIPATAWK